MDQMETILTLFSFLLVFSYLVVIKRLKKTQYKVDDLLEENTEHQQKLKTFTQQQKNPLGNLLYGTKEAVTIHFDKSGKIKFSINIFKRVD